MEIAVFTSAGCDKCRQTLKHLRDANLSRKGTPVSILEYDISSPQAVRLNVTQAPEVVLLKDGVEILRVRSPLTQEQARELVRPEG